MSRSNNFDFIRFLAALMVIIWHAATLTGHQSFDPLFRYTLGNSNLGHIGVAIFFVTSGFLIAGAWERDPNWMRFFANRVIRIFPGLIVANLFCVMIIGPLATKLPVGDYLRNPDTWQFLWRNISLANLQWHLPGCFQENSFPNAVNGSLWTIPLEIMCYVIVLVVGILGFISYKCFSFAALISSLVCMQASHSGYQWIFPATIFEILNFHDYVMLSAFFWSGMVIYQNKPILEPRLDFAVLMLGTLLISSKFDNFHLFEPTAISYLVYYIAFAPQIKFQNFGKIGDLSYGAYLYSFPIQQILSQPEFKLTSSHAIWNIVVALAITLTISALSWRFIESPALRLKKSKFLQNRLWYQIDIFNVVRSKLNQYGNYLQKSYRSALTVSVIVLSCILYYTQIRIPSSLDLTHSSKKQSLFGGWHEAGKNEKYRWINKTGSAVLSKKVDHDVLSISGYVPDNILTPTLLGVDLMMKDKLVYYEDYARPKLNEEWQINCDIPVSKLPAGIYTLKLCFDNAQVASLNDNRMVSGLFTKIEMR